MCVELVVLQALVLASLYYELVLHYFFVVQLSSKKSKSASVSAAK